MDYNVTYRQKDNGIQVIISYKDNSGKWKQKSKQGFPNTREGKKKAKIQADIILQELKESITNFTYNEFEHITLGEFIELHLKHMKIHLEPNTIISYRAGLSHFESIYNLEISKIRYIDLQQCVDNLVTKGYKYSSIRNYIQKIKYIFNTAINNYDIPIKNITKKLTIEKEKNPSTKRALTNSELNTLLEKTTNSKYYIMIFLASRCGLRIGEIVGLTWNDIDFKNATLSINKQWKLLKNNTFGFGELKSKNSNRILPLTPNMIKELKELKNNSIYNIDGRILSYKNTKVITVSINKHIKRLGFDISFHELRHTFATNLISNGIDFKTAAKLLGHDVEQTMKTYSHVTDDMLKRASEIMENIF
ncbi:tyrosine-type recombinase/integrase [Eubacterium multiforme]|uniref:Integrase n=1 Tax=Eubacterium multiforme TaxID=83339 RepID=A0ABT9UXZ9_9FIRM|nr:site-specific integrase [Eubacterium multiforme]MDQ0151185.1 integrase [Eubacterium multiforme]